MKKVQENDFEKAKARDLASLRVFFDEAASGARNMAVDEALLRVGGQDSEAAPLLRFYSWRPACLSVGRFQKVQNLCLDSATPWVRRPTGGRAVWHEHEVTYSLVLREEHLPRNARSVADSYRWIGEGFLRGLQELGINANIARGTTPNQETDRTSTRSDDLAPNCFQTATRADFVVNERKILGAAQCRQGGAILQHGSLLLDIQRDSWHNRVGGDLSQIVTLRDLGVSSSREQIQEILAQSVAQLLDMPIKKTTLSSRENQMANVLLDKYKSVSWNKFGRDWQEKLESRIQDKTGNCPTNEENVEDVL